MLGLKACGTTAQLNSLLILEGNVVILSFQMRTASLREIVSKQTSNWEPSCSLLASDLGETVRSSLLIQVAATGFMKHSFSPWESQGLPELSLLSKALVTRPRLSSRLARCSNSFQLLLWLSRSLGSLKTINTISCFRRKCYQWGTGRSIAYFRQEYLSPLRT